MVAVLHDGYRLLGILLVLVLIGCAEEPAQPLRIGTNIWPGYEPLYLARSLGYFSDQDVRLVEYSSSSQVLRAYRNGAIDAAALTLDEVLMLAEEGFEPRVVLIMDVSAGGDVIIGQAGLTAMGDLKGLRVGFENSALGSYVLSRALELANLSIPDVIKVPLELDEHEGAFLQHQVDAVVTFEPVRNRLLSQGGVLLFDSNQIPGEIVDVLVVREKALEKERRRVRNLLYQWFRALAYLDAQEEDAAERMSLRLGLPPEEVLQVYSGLLFPDRDRNVEMLGGGDLKKSARLLSRVMSENGLLIRPVNVDRVFSDPVLD